MAHILIVDDDESLRESLGETIASLGHVPHLAGDAEAAYAVLARHRIDVAFVDLRLPGPGGLEILDRLKADPRYATLPIVLLTAYADADNTIAAMKAGAFDHLTKPVGRGDLSETIDRALPAAGHQAMPPVTSAVTETHRLIGTSPAMRTVHKLIGIAASSTVNVLVQGETGTGKELVARAIHTYGDRTARPFVAVNCAAIPHDLLESELFGHERGAFSGAVQMRVGRFREADGGTLFLDEIGDMTLAMQAKLLRVLQDRLVTSVGGTRAQEVDVRIVSATHHDLVALVAEGRFREDLFYRLNVLRIDLPPLRARGADILLIAQDRLSAHASGIKRLSPDAASALLAHAWPGNVRELDNLMQRVALVARGDVILRDDLGLATAAIASEIDDATDLDFAAAVGRFEKALLERALAAEDGNRSAAARRLGMHRQLLYAKLKEHGIE